HRRKFRDRLPPPYRHSPTLHLQWPNTPQPGLKTRVNSCINHKNMDTQHSKINPSSSQTPSAARDPRRPDSGRLFGGIVIVVIGCVWLARQVGMDLPFWLFRWQMLLIGLGIFIGARSSFRNPGWIILVAIGSVSLIDYYYHIDLWHFFWP